MKTIGILGGVGPQTTAEVYLSIIELVRKSRQTEYPPIVIYNLPFPFVIEQEAIVQGINAEKMIPYLVEGARVLEKSGADFGILPCNTLHKFMPEIRAATTLPFLSIVDETVQALKERRVHRIGILATETTIASRIYEHALGVAGIELIRPLRDEQSQVNETIVELLAGNKDGRQKSCIERVCDSLDTRGAEVILLACTDFQIIARDVHTTIPLVDTTNILIRASVREMDTA